MKPLMKIAVQVRSLVRQMASRIEWFPPLLGRLSVGAVFLEAGWGKLHNIPKVVEFFTSLGIPAPQLQAPFVAMNEFVCGGLLILGLFTRLATIPIAASMVVAIA